MGRERRVMEQLKPVIRRASLVLAVFACLAAAETAVAAPVAGPGPSILTQREVLLLSMAGALVAVLLAVIAFQIIGLVKLRERVSDAAAQGRAGTGDRSGAIEGQTVLTAAFDHVVDAVAIFDPTSRLVFCNSNFRRFYPAAAHVLHPGTRFGEIQRVCVENGVYPLDQREWGAFLASRIKAFEHPKGPVEIQLADGRWLRIDERRSRDGGVISVHRDVTELKRFEASQRETQELFSTVFHANPALSSISDLESGVIIDVNDTWVRTLGYRREDVVGKSVIDLGIVVDPGSRAGMVSDLKEGKPVANIEMRLRPKSGETRDFLMSADLIELSGRQCLLLVFQDITDLKMAQDRLVDAIESINEAFALYDADERLVLCNSRYRELLSIVRDDVVPGARFGDLVAKTVRLGLHPEAIGNEEEFVRQRVAAFRRCEGSEEWRVSPDGWILISERRTKRGEIVGIRTNITELKRREQALRESEARYRSLVETLPDAILVHRAHTIVFANAVAAELLGVEAAADLIGRRILDFVDGRDQELFKRREKRLLEIGGVNPPTEMKFRRVDGRGVDVEIRVSRLITEEIPAIEMVIRDLTQRKKAERELIQTSKMATLGEMAAGMAHELSQPLNIIRFSAEGTLLKIRRGQATQGFQEKQLQIIESQAQRMSEIMDHMRVFSRTDTADVEPFSPVETAASAVDLIRNQFRPDGITIATRLPKHCGIVRGRPVQLEQVILNLLNNARDAIVARIEAEPEGSEYRGHIDVAVNSDRRSGVIRIIVSDNGTGIEPDKFGRVFEPFYTSKEVGAGTGLGLSVSYNIVNAMSGTITAQNTRDGAEFVITLPVFADADGAGGPEASTDAGAAAPSSPEVLAPRHVLVVDDEVRAVKAMADYLTDEGYRVSVASDGIEAFERFQLDPADIVVTDIRMPRGDGRELIRNLRACAPDLPIIVHTGHVGLKEAAEENFESDNTTVVRKPSSLLELGEAVQRFASRR